MLLFQIEFVHCLHLIGQMMIVFDSLMMMMFVDFLRLIVMLLLDNPAQVKQKKRHLIS